MKFIDYTSIVREAWQAYDDTREIVQIEDISAKVSTNHVYRIVLSDRNIIVAKFSYFGKFEHFVEDHSIINTLSNNLPSPFENVLARSLMKGTNLFVYHHESELIDAWVIFYRPIHNKQSLPKRLNESQIKKLAKEMAHFHKACNTVKGTLPPSSKTMLMDVNHLESILKTENGEIEFHKHLRLIQHQCDSFRNNYAALNTDQLDIIPVFVDWNIGNFSVTPNFKLFSRWDYDWFRMSTRMIDFYFFARVVSDVGDRTVFTYNIDVLMEERFMIFLKAYHEVYPLIAEEILFLKEAYRFFLLNYVVKYGRYFFHEIFAKKLQKEAFEDHLPQLDEKFDPSPILKTLKL